MFQPHLNQELITPSQPLAELVLFLPGKVIQFTQRQALPYQLAQRGQPQSQIIQVIGTQHLQIGLNGMEAVRGL